MNPNLYDQLSSLFLSYPSIDVFNSFLIGICYEHLQQSLSLESLFLQISDNFPGLLRDSIMKRIPDFKFLFTDTNTLGPVEVKFSIPIISRIKEFDSYAMLFQDLSNFQWFYLGAFIARNPSFDIGVFLEKVYLKSLVNPSSQFNDDYAKVALLAPLLDEELNFHQSSLNTEGVIPKKVEGFSEELNTKKVNSSPQSNLRKIQQNEKEDHTYPSREPILTNAHNYIKDGLVDRKDFSPLGCCFWSFPSKIFEKSDCRICLDSMLIKWFEVILKNCKHSFHAKCLQKYLQTMIDEKSFPIRCPMDGCSQLILEHEIIKNLDKKYQEKFYAFTLKHFVETNKSRIFCCPTPICEYFVFLDDLLGRRHFQCGKCEKRYCMKCQRDWHYNMTCEEVQEREGFSEIALNNGYGQCLSCQMFIEKVGGCQHMTCICMSEFCWVCRRQISKCGCNRTTRA